MYLNGIVLVSAVIDFRTLIPSGSNDLAYSLFLPSYTATAWYHQALGSGTAVTATEAGGP